MEKHVIFLYTEEQQSESRTETQQTKKMNSKKSVVSL